MAYIPVELRRHVIERARGRCEYCLIPANLAFAAHEVDHIYAQKHGVGETEENLAYSCSQCNRHKGSDLASIDPETGEVVTLFNPRRDRWREHFTLVDGAITPLTAKGRVTVRLLQFNTPDRVDRRRRWIVTGEYTLPD